MTALRRRLGAISGDKGTVSLYLVVIFMALLSAAGLVIDGGYAIAARQKAANVAEQAARAGANAMNKNSLRSGGAAIVNPGRGKTAALAYLAAAGETGTVTISGATVTVSVTIKQPTAILGAFGTSEISVTGESTATSIRGITTEEG